MKRPLSPALWLAAAVFFTLAGGSASAQRSSSCEIKKIEPALVDSPQITVGNYRKNIPNRAPQWLEIDVTFDLPQPDKSATKFADEITVNYYILLNNKEANKDGKRTLLTGSVSHADVLFDKGLHASAFVSPKTLLKFFDGKAPTNPTQAVVDVGVTVSDSTGVIARHAWKSQVRGDKGWWDNSSDFTEVTGRVLDKDRTPFAPLFWDYALPPKPRAGA